MPLWRIRDRTTFHRLRADGDRRRSGPVTVTAVAIDDGNPPRVAFAIGTRVGGAVTRNRLRRQLRAIVADLAPRSGAYLVALRPEAADCDAADLRLHVDRALTGLGARS
jgi:ribonuclease P protein component